MAQIVELDPTQLLSVRNNRNLAEETRIDGLAESIAEHGQQSPIQVKQENNGDLTIVSGHRRTMACRHLSIPVKAIIVDNMTEQKARLLTLIENDARLNTNDIDKAEGYRDAIAEGSAPEDIARAIGRNVNYITDRLELLELSEETQHFVKSGELTIGYARHMVGLDRNFQRRALEIYNATPHTMRRPKWFERECEELRRKQSQQSLNFGFWSDSANETPLMNDIPLKERMPADPATYTPKLDPLNMAESIAESIAQCEQYAIEWKENGHKQHSQAFKTIAQTLRAIAQTIGDRQETIETEGDRIFRLIAERSGAGGSLTTKEVLQYGNVTSAEASPILAELVNSGRVAKERSGRGFRYSVVGPAQ